MCTSFCRGNLWSWEQKNQATKSPILKKQLKAFCKPPPYNECSLVDILVLSLREWILNFWWLDYPLLVESFSFLQRDNLRANILFGYPSLCNDHRVDNYQLTPCSITFVAFCVNDHVFRQKRISQEDESLKIITCLISMAYKSQRAWQCFQRSQKILPAEGTRNIFIINIIQP